MPDLRATDSPAAASGRACRHWSDATGRRCGRRDGTRHYVTGWRCPEHTPAALAGQPEPGQGTYCAPGRHYCTATNTPCPDAATADTETSTT